MFQIYNFHFWEKANLWDSRSSESGLGGFSQSHHPEWTRRLLVRCSPASRLLSRWGRGVPHYTVIQRTAQHHHVFAHRGLHFTHLLLLKQTSALVKVVVSSVSWKLSQTAIFDYINALTYSSPLNKVSQNTSHFWPRKTTLHYSYILKDTLNVSFICGVSYCSFKCDSTHMWAPLLKHTFWIISILQIFWPRLT